MVGGEAITQRDHTKRSAEVIGEAEELLIRTKKGVQSDKPSKSEPVEADSARMSGLEREQVE